MLRCIILLIFSVQVLLLSAQSVSVVEGSYLISLNEGQEATKVLQAHSIPYSRTVSLGKMMNLWLVEVSNSENPAAYLQRLAALPEVTVAQANHLIINREETNFKGGTPDIAHSHTLPNDPDFPSQYYLHNTGQTGGLANADLNLPQAWNFTTGGQSSIGDEIVVAVIDHGFDLTHPDLSPVFWENEAEIPNNHLDDDGNGYVDDVLGWNVFSENDDLQGLSMTHGTQIAGIIGAKGNNAYGISGLNWDVKLMGLVAGQTEAHLLQAYAYIHEMRRRYNQSNGTEGAFVVAVNASMGINYGMPSDAPLWCAVFDFLGSVGILNCSPAPNLSVNVDSVGDLPTTCPSDYLITSTALNHADQLTANAAWGAQHIDLAAYGKDIYTTNPNQTCVTTSGTSFSSPQIAGAVALLYAADCTDLPALSRNNPSAAALYVRQNLLENAQLLPVLQGKTAVNAKLDVGETLKSYQNNCSVCTPPFSVFLENRQVNRLSIRWSETTMAHRTDVRWRTDSASDWTLLNQHSSPMELTGLDTCQRIDLQLRSWCDGEMGEWSESHFFKTLGCCEAIQSLAVDSIETNALSLSWIEENYHNGVQVQWRSEFTTDWDSSIVQTNSTILEGLLPCTDYEIRVKTLCLDMPWSPTVFTKTKGCGACTDHDYCILDAPNAQSEFIDSIFVGQWAFKVGAGNGYRDFSGQEQSVFYFSPNEMLPIRCVPGFQSAVFKEYFRVFLDLDYDGQFNDPEECIFDAGYACTCPVEGQFPLPPNALTGMTRLRVMMRSSNANTPPNPCSPFPFGQYADFCAMIGGASSLEHNDSTVPDYSIFPNPTSGSFSIEATSTIPLFLRGFDAFGRLVFEQNCTTNSPISSKPLPGGLYFITIWDGEKWYSKQLTVVSR